MAYSVKRTKEKKKLFFSKKARILVDILLIIGFVIVSLCSHLEDTFPVYGHSLHCITGMIWFLWIGVHTLQNRKFIKAFTQKKVMLKNKIIAFTAFTFILMLFSILSFIIGFNTSFLHFHFIVGRFFPVAILIHTIDKYKRFITLFKKPK